jgi:glycosyltransferase involved in cell wall biosynthesis
MEDEMGRDISVLVCTRNRPDKLQRAISSILANSYRDFELIVVDQSAEDTSRTKIEAFADQRIRYIRTATVGLSRARNIAIKAARTEIVVFTDDDCVCDAQWLHSIVAEYQHDSSLKAVFGRVVAYGTGNPGMFCPCLIEAPQRRIVDAPAIPQRVLGAGNNMSFRMEVFREIGLFIESLGAGTLMKSGEDTEFVYRALRKRLKFVYSPEPLVYHDNWSSLTHYPVLARAYLLGGSAVLVKFALMFDGVALGELVRVGYYILRNKLGAGGIFKALFNFSIGCATGIVYLMAPPPRLVEGASRREELA